ncbi:ring-hydroxylating dioxygenase ferredoxin reductase family protein [Pseudooceanicola sp. CBS1P-1]|uniref:2Fe-2S iron-sulfur cluster binding domain-containing protein n=1 Tax=Pseudooceanicola albus TaxID=2692189 RepID=A0A6L7G379_9RHOB|nr:MULTISPECIES: benzoate 1,2-dioxygenase electron transfer component BenC [Pseudooceanicola]MBT9385327.1 ring-hydroxylating dioxygenase ferredoxin reductase family protein [Pseudooceanicola endophyticus]MXN18814.1 2Fe-2S iron-sulfur cluster binding domain-containing protein [Pseudooceanicola albus]
MSYRIALNFEDGVTRVIACNPAETVMNAAYRQKVNLPVDCSDGVCGTCKCRCEQGAFELGDDYLEEALSEEEAAGGLVLTCQMVPGGDCVIAVPVPSSACKLTPESHAGVITRLTRLSEATFELGITLPEGPDFLPGQYVNLALPGQEITRSYSFSSAPGAREATFLIRNVPGGRMSRYLSEQAQIGDAASFTGPYGSFFLRARTRPVLLLAGGTGLAPILSMLEVMAAEGETTPVHLVYGVNTDADLVQTERLEALGARLPGFTWCATVADAGAAHPLKGYVTAHLDDAQLHAGEVDIYLCGPPPMVEAVRRFLAEKGVEPAHFHYEKFTPSATEAAA